MGVDEWHRNATQYFDSRRSGFGTPSNSCRSDSDLATWQRVNSSPKPAIRCEICASKAAAPAGSDPPGKNAIRGCFEPAVKQRVNDSPKRYVLRPHYST